MFGLVHSIATTAAHVHDIVAGGDLLQGDEQCVWGDAGYRGIEKREEHQHRTIEWWIAMRPGRRRRLEPGSIEEEIEHRKASIRAKVEHPFRYVKRVFGYANVRYRGLAKNTERISLLLGFTNLLISQRYARG